MANLLARVFLVDILFPQLTLYAAFGAYTTTVRKIADDPDNPKMIHNFLGGAVAGAAVCSLSPIELGTGSQSELQTNKISTFFHTY